MSYLEGGRINQIARVGETVQRPVGAWTATIQRLLAHVRAQGFLAVPVPLGYDAEHEIVSFIAGEVSNYPLSDAAQSEEVLISAAKLLRAYHDTTTSFVHQLQGDEVWMLPVREPVEVICHGDFAPYNVVLRENTAVAIIDFDTAHPAPRVWDIAYALYRWAPLTSPDNHDGFGSEQQKHARARLFCDAYGLSAAERTGLLDWVIVRLQILVDFMQAEAKAGNAAFQANLAAGHHLLYLRDITYLQANREWLQSGIAGL